MSIGEPVPEGSRSADPAIWQTHDPAWMQARRELWPKIQLRLAGAKDLIPRKCWKHIKNYYFYGTPLQRVHDIDAAYRECCRRWLHPTGEGLGDINILEAIDNIRHYFQMLMTELSSKIAHEGDAEYGVMGGREQDIILAINPSYSRAELKDFGTGKLEPACDRPKNIFWYCVGASIAEISCYSAQPGLRGSDTDCGYIAYLPGLVLWDHLSHAMEVDERLFFHSPPRKHDETYWQQQRVMDDLAKARRRDGGTLHNLLVDLLTFHDRDATDDSRQRPLTVQHVEYLVTRYEQRDFSDALLAWWDEAKRSIKTK